MTLYIYIYTYIHTYIHTCMYNVHTYILMYQQRLAHGPRAPRREGRRLCRGMIVFAKGDALLRNIFLTKGELPCIGKYPWRRGFSPAKGNPLQKVNSLIKVNSPIKVNSRRHGQVGVEAVERDLVWLLLLVVRSIVSISIMITTHCYESPLLSVWVGVVSVALVVILSIAIVYV